MTRTTYTMRGLQRPLVVTLLLGILLALASSLFTALPAHAVECVPDAATGCVRGVMKLSDGEPAAGVALTLSGPGAAAPQRAETDAAGTWAFEVTAAGEYTVAVTAASLPAGQYLTSVDQRHVEVQLNTQVSALFPLTDDEARAYVPEGDAGGSESGSDGSAAAAGTGATETVGSFSWPRFWQQLISGVRLGLLISLASLGLSLVFGTTGLSNFAQGELVTMGGLLAAAFMTLTGKLWLAGVLAVVVAAGFGWTQDRIIWKPLRRRRVSRIQMMIVSIGISITLQYLFQFFFGAGVVRIDRSTAQTMTILGVTLTVQSYIAMGVSLLAVIGVGLALKYTRFGRATRAVSDNTALAQASGINVDRVIRIVWVVSASLAALSGVFFGLVFNGLNWFTGGQMLLLFFAAITLGGLGTAFGAFVGSMIIGMMVELTNIWLPGDLKYVTALLLLILILLVRPQGLFGRKERIG